MELKKVKRFGVEKGKKIGSEKSKKDIAKKLLELGIQIEKIMKATNLTKEEIEKLKNEK